MSGEKDTECRTSAKCPSTTERAGGSLGLKFRNEVMTRYVDVNHPCSDDSLNLCVPSFSHLSAICKLFAIFGQHSCSYPINILKI